MVQEAIKMGAKEDLLEKFMKLEKVDWGETEGYHQKNSLKEIESPSNIMIPRKLTDFYQLCDLYNTFGVEYKVYRKNEFYVVEVTK